MKKITLVLTICMVSFFITAQTNLFFDDFESYADFEISNVGSWTLIDVDGQPTYGFTGITFPESGNPRSFQVFNSTTTTPPLTPSATSDWSGRNSIKGMVCFASVPTTSGNDDWLISPIVNLASSGNTLSFWYKACDANFSQEQFNVGVSTTDTMPGSFTIITPTPVSVPASDITWREFTFDLSAYDNQSIYIGINCISFDQFGLMIDDFSVDTSLSVNEFERNQFSHFYNKESKTLQLESSELPLDSIEIYSMLGQSVLTKNLSESYETINVNDLNDGMYLTKVTINGNSQTFKFIKN